MWMETLIQWQSSKSGWWLWLAGWPSYSLLWWIFSSTPFTHHLSTSVQRDSKKNVLFIFVEEKLFWRKIPVKKKVICIYTYTYINISQIHLSKNTCIGKQTDPEDVDVQFTKDANGSMTSKMNREDSTHSPNKCFIDSNWSKCFSSNSSVETDWIPKV